MFRNLTGGEIGVKIRANIFAENTMKIPSDVKFIIDTLDKRGYEAYAVGGCVRDAILGREPNDWDITTNATPDQMKECFAGQHVIETGLKHGTLTVMLHHVGYEVTTYRIDGEYSDHRRPDSVEFVKDLRLDLERRDFTVNAMATADGENIVDLFDGRGDLERHVIRCVGDPYKRFTEDALRILRALRFASVYDFAVDPDTANAAFELRDTLKNVSGERICVELKKLLCGKGAERILTLYPWIIFTIFPELEPMEGRKQNNPHHAYDVWTHTVKTIANSPADPIYRLTMLFHDSGKPKAYYLGEDGLDHFKGHPKYSVEIAETCLPRLKPDTESFRKILVYIREHDLRVPADKKAIRKQMVRLGTDTYMALFPILKADYLSQNPALIPQKKVQFDEVERLSNEILAEGDCVTLKALAVGGKDMMALGLKGKDVGEMLNTLLLRVCDEEIQNEKEALLTEAQRLING